MALKKITVGRLRRGGIAGAAVACGALLLAACGSGASSSASDSTSTSSSASDSSSTAPGGVNLHGATINLAVGATPSIDDTTVYLISQILQSWGAHSTVVNQTGDPAAVRVVLAGDAQIASIAVSSAINSHLMVFGPSQPRLDYRLVGASKLTSVNQLPGHVYGTSNEHGIEQLMLEAVLQKYHINPSSVTETIAGGASVRVGAMLTGHIDATFETSEGWLALKPHGFHDLATMSKVAPRLSDSFLAASPQWLKSNPKLALAVDEAWVKAAQIFNNDPAQWQAAASAYTSKTSSSSSISSVYSTLKAGNTWPASSSAFQSSSASYQESLAQSVGIITSAPPLSQWFTQQVWQKAVAAEGLS